MADQAARRAPVRIATAPAGHAALPFAAEEDVLDWLENHPRTARIARAPFAADEDRAVFVIGVLLFAAALAGALRH